MVEHYIAKKKSHTGYRDSNDSQFVTKKYEALSFIRCTAGIVP